MSDAGGPGVEGLFQETLALEKQFKLVLENQLPWAVDLSTLLSKIRGQTENVLFGDIEFALNKTVEERLWTNVHYRVIDDYRKRLANHEKQYEVSRPVEYRKLIDHYTRFLKDCTNYYRILIQKLVSNFNIVELHPIVSQFKLEVEVAPDGPKFQSKKIKGLVFTAVQSCLIKLGDISRYRALMPARTKTAPKPDYGPAYGYYILAQALLPENGAPANQLAVLSTYSKDFLASTYYFYRALACDDPFTTASNNLALGFRKLQRDGVGIDGVEREDIGALTEAFLKMHAKFFNVEPFNNPSVLQLLEEVIVDRVIEAKFLTRLTFINLSAFYVATQREALNVEEFLFTLLDHFSLLLRLLSQEIELQPPSDDPASYITPVVRRIASSIRLYSKWLVVHHSQIPQSFWPQYIIAVQSVKGLWTKQSPPKSSLPLEEDLAAAGFAPLEALQESKKRRTKRDKARIGNRKKGFERLLLQWGRNGGDTLVQSRNQGSQHPNVEMTLRLADLLSDAIEIASIPTSAIEFVDGVFRARSADEVIEGQQFISTGVPTEALGRMSLDEPEDAGERSFSEPQESSEEELGMAFSPGKMVDDIVGDNTLHGHGSHSYYEPEEGQEEIIFSGRATRKQFTTSVSTSAGFGRSDNAPSPILLPPTITNHPSPLASPTALAPPEPSVQPKTVADLMSRVLAFSNRTTSPAQTPRNLSPHLQPIPSATSFDDQYNSAHARQGTHSYEDGRNREGSPVGVIGQGRASPRRSNAGDTGSPRWSGAFGGL